MAIIDSENVVFVRKSFCLSMKIIDRRRSDWFWIRIIVLLALTLDVPIATAAPAIQFNRDIRPILSENCFACHGPDNSARKGGLRLDTKEGIFDPTPKHQPAVVPGNLEKGELWARITATDPDEVMPPPKS